MVGGTGGNGCMGYTGGNAGTSQAPTSVTDAIIFGTSTVGPGSGLDPAGPIGSGAPQTGSWSRYGPSGKSGPDGYSGGFFVLRYNP